MKYVSVSGGADSTAMALLLWERGEDFEMIFADTGAEFPENYVVLYNLSQTTGKRLNVVSGSSFFSCLANRDWFLPGPRVRWCTQSLKAIPIDRFLTKALGGGESIECCVGIRADEPRRFNFNDSYSNPDLPRTMPLVEADLGRCEVHQLCTKYDLLNPLYNWRTNVSCFCCFFQRKSDWLGLLKYYPPLYALAEAWEEASFKTSRSKHSWNAAFTLKNFREADEAQIKLWPECNEETCLICQW